MSLGSRNDAKDEIARLEARKAVLGLRARIIQELRNCLIERGFLEVETPYILPQPAPERHIDPIAVEGGYLHTSPEICMKRLLAAGFGPIFQICKCFRRGERGGKHLPEFTMLEWYRVGIDYKGLMVDCENVVSEVVNRTSPTQRITYGGKEIEFGPPWERISVKDAFEQYAEMDVFQAVKEGRFEELLVQKVEPNLGWSQPAFLYDFPAPLAAMAKRRDDDPRIEERFELYVGGLEIANGFTELNDQQQQRERLKQEIKAREEMGKEIFPLPERFLEAVGRMPEAAGIALGIDRLIMLLGDKPDIKDVVAFTPEEL